MKWRGRRKSKNVQDRRGGSMGKIGGLGLGGIVIVALVYFLGGDPSQVLNQINSGETESQQVQTTEENDELAHFVSVVLAETEDVWNQLMPQAYNREYVEPDLVLFDGQVSSGCGMASSATGPFYCPRDQSLFIDLSFQRDLKNKLNAPGDFAMAYVIAHEVGHHIQKLIGNTDRVHRQRGNISEEEYNQLSVRLELQADFLAGVWAHYADKQMNILDEGDIDEALNAANAIGDDRLQKQSQGHVVPESFTHGTSAQRIRWFKKGYQTGDPAVGNTFDIPYSQL